tara:strand:- start:383 stop:826 length:444 start_codon:yes stop_codon:yes gene_type:complete
MVYKSMFSENLMRQLLLLLLLVAPTLVWADTSTDIAADTRTQHNQLEKALTRNQQETQSVFQKFSMIQELRRIEIQEEPVTMLPSTSMNNNSIPKYEEKVRQNQKKQERIKQYTTDMDQLYIRYQTLEDERELLIEQMEQLIQTPEK